MRAMKTTMSDHAEDYLKRMAKLRPASTVTHNRNIILPFARWRDATRKSARSLQGHEVEDYMVELAERLAPGTWNTYKVLILKFVRWGAVRGHWSPTANIILESREPRPKPKIYLDDQQMDALLERAGDPYTRFVLAALRWTLCREQELLAVHLKDLDLTSNRLTIVRTKGRRSNPQDKVDRIPIVAELRDELDVWLAEYERLCGPLQPEWRLIPQRLGRPAAADRRVDAWKYYPTQKRRLLSVIVKPAVAALLPNLTPEELLGVGSHTLRRSGGLEMREALRDAGESEADHQVMAMFGHKSIQTTYGYFGEDRDRARRDVALAGRRLRPKKAEVVKLRAVEDAG